MSAGQPRPSRVTAVASTTTSAAPPTARLPRWTRCQSLAIPSSALYWHIGETAMRLRNVTPRRVNGGRRAGGRDDVGGLALRWIGHAGILDQDVLGLWEPWPHDTVQGEPTRRPRMAT